LTEEGKQGICQNSSSDSCFGDSFVGYWGFLERNSLVTAWIGWKLD